MSGSGSGSGSSGDALTLPAEAPIRLVFGRMDPATTPDVVAQDARLPALRAAFPGF